jgi:hypothetical protein
MRTLIKSGWTMGMAAVFGLIAVPEAEAQFCAGYPTMSGQSSLGVKAAFPDRGDIFGVEGSYNMAGPLAVFASFNLLMPADDGHDHDHDNVSIFGGGVAYEVGGFIPAIPAGLSVCPVAAVGFSTDHGATTLTVPVGIGFGTVIGAEGISVMPYVMPQFVLTRISARDVDVLSDTNFGIEAGFLARFANFYAGVTLNRLFVDHADTDFAIRAGLTFGSPF